MYNVVSTIKHNGKVFNAGESVELSEAFAKPLLEAGVISTDKVENASPLPAKSNKAPKAFSKMNKKQLIAAAAEKGIVLEETLTQKEMVAVLEKE